MSDSNLTLREFSKKYIKNSVQCLLVLIIFSILVVIMHLLPFNKLGTGYIEQQWFINYSSGFIRRGLFGEMAKWANLDLGELYLIFRFLITFSFTSFFWIVWRSFGRIDKKNIFYFLLVVTSPIFYSAFSKLNGRFDLIFTLVITIFFLIKNQKKSKILLYASMFFLGLVHELWLILYVPLYLILTCDSKSKQESISPLLINYLLIGLLWFLTREDPSNLKVLCEEISSKMENFIYTCTASGDISFATQDTLGAIKNSVFWNRDVNLHSAIISLIEFLCTTSYILIASASICFVIMKANLDLRLYINRIMLLAMLYLFISLIALDWGRFLVDILQVFFIYVCINNKFTINAYIDKKYLILLMILNFIFIKLVFTRILII